MHKNKERKTEYGEKTVLHWPVKNEMAQHFHCGKMIKYCTLQNIVSNFTEASLDHVSETTNIEFITLLIGKDGIYYRSHKAATLSTE